MEGEVLDAGEGCTRGVRYSYALTSTGANRWTYEWWLGNFIYSQAPYLETEDFVAGQYRWRLKFFFPKVRQRDVEHMGVNLVSLNSADVSVNLMVEAVNHTNPQNSRVSGGRFTFKQNEEHGVPKLQDRFSAFSGNSGFLHQGSYVIKASIEIVPTEANRGASLLQPSVSRGATRTVHLSILTDDFFKQQLDRMHPFGMVYLPAGDVLPVPASTVVSSLTAGIAQGGRERGRDVASARFWICGSRSDGSMRVECPLRTRLSSTAETIGELCTKSDNAGTRRLTLYAEKSKDGSRLPELSGDSWILFCKYMQPEGNKLTYLGSITIRKSRTVYDLEARARQLTQWPRGATSQIVMQRQDCCPALVARTVTLENSGLRNGDVFLLCRIPPRCTINLDRLRSLLEHSFLQSFQSLTLSSGGNTSRQQQAAIHNDQRMSERLKGPPVSQTESTVNGQSSNGRQPEDEEQELCAICLDKPRTSGFLHADSEVHLCACIECADAIMQTANPRCPLCNQGVIHMIKKVR